MPVDSGRDVRCAQARAYERNDVTSPALRGRRVAVAPTSARRREVEVRNVTTLLLVGLLVLILTAAAVQLMRASAL